MGDADSLPQAALGADTPEPYRSPWLLATVGTLFAATGLLSGWFTDAAIQNLEVLGPDGFVMRPAPRWVDPLSWLVGLFPVGMLLVVSGVIVWARRSAKPWTRVSVSFGLLAAAATAFSAAWVFGAFSASASGPAAGILFPLLGIAVLLTPAGCVSAIVGLIRREGGFAILGLIICLAVGCALVVAVGLLVFGLAMLSTG